MRKPCMLRCESSNVRHTYFILFDQQGANCGAITMHTGAVADFIRYDWQGDVQWNGHTQFVAVKEMNQ